MTEQVHITIVGTGCIGTSIGLALQRAQEPLRVVGHDKKQAHATSAQRMKAIHAAEWNLINACEPADLIILALPLAGIPDTLKAIAPYLKPGCVITDTASLKQPVLRWAAELLPEHVNFVGGNPIVTGEGYGPEAARADLFEGSLFCVVADQRTHPDAVKLVSSYVALLGARPYYLEAAEHDGLMAGAVHLPLALALALTDGAIHSSGWRELRKVAGGDFERLTSLIGEDAEALSSLLLANQEPLLRWLDTYGETLRSVRELLATSNRETLTKFVEAAIIARRQWLVDRRNRFAEGSPVGEIERPNLLRQMLLGGGFRRRR